MGLSVRAVRTDFGGWGHMRDVTTGRPVDPPASPIPLENRPVETVRLVPMGGTQIRITLFPWTSCGALAAAPHDGRLRSGYGP